MITSALYFGDVRHSRFGPRPHRLRYRVFQVLLDLDEAPSLRTRLFSVGRFNLFSHYDRDHGDGRSPLRAWVDERLADAGLEGGGPILLLAMPRVLGHVFNPISLYYCHDRSGRLTAVIHEVNNTHGERHAYVLATDPSLAGPIRQTCPKAFRVSPFLGMDLSYDFDLSRPGAALRVGVGARDAAGQPVLWALFKGRREAMTDRNLAVAFLSLPLMTLKVVAAIHFEAAMMWLKGIRPPLAAALIPAAGRRDAPPGRRAPASGRR